jgi:hypothetical protein
MSVTRIVLNNGEQTLRLRLDDGRNYFEFYEQLVRDAAAEVDRPTWDGGKGWTPAQKLCYYLLLDCGVFTMLDEEKELAEEAKC